MTKSKLLYIALAAGTLSFSSCKKDFLEKTPSEKLTTDQVSTESLIKGLYAQAYQTGTGGTTGHDDFGQKGYDIYMDLLSGDMALQRSVYGWYRTIANLTAPVNFTTNPNYAPWRYYYSVIYSANSIIDKLGGTDADVASISEKVAYAQAKAIRANSYFYLANLYAQEVYGTGSQKILPLYTNSSEVNKPKATSKEVFDLIIADLTQAVDLLNGFNRSNKGEVNQDVAKAMLSYAYAARGTQADWQKVAELTKSVIDGGKYGLTTYSETTAQVDASGKVTNSVSGFNNLETKSWIWGADIQTSTSLDLVSWWGQIDYYTYSYQAAGDYKGMDRGLYDQIKATDVRKGQFNTNYLMPRNKFFDPARVQMGQRTVTTDYLYLRLDELVLLNAEANAKLGNTALAIKSLNTILAERFKDGADYAYINDLSGQALLDEIYFQTRVELWGEGKSYLALKRNKAKVTRGSNHLYLAGRSYNYNADELTLDIPQAEITNNPNLDK